MRPVISTFGFLVVLVAATLVFGCGKRARRDAAADRASTQPTFSLAERLAIEAARDAVAEREHWSGRASFDAQRDGDGWLVYVERQPSVPGGHRVVRVDAEGKVVDYKRGR